MKFPSLLLFTALATLAACNKNDDSPTIDFGLNGGITSRDASGRLQGNPDPTDWTLDGNWNQQEQDLFRSLGLDLNATATGNVTTTQIIAWPNPIGAGQAVFRYDTPVPVSCKFVIVDAKYQVVGPMLSSPAVRNAEFYYNVFSSAYQQGKRYRLYYVLYDGTALYYKGHGDIKISL